MKKINFLVVMLALAVMLAGTCFAADVKVSTDVEIVYSDIKVDDSTAEVNSNKFYTTDADVDVSVAIDDNTKAKIKLDVDDFAGGSASEDSLMEEIYIEFNKIAGQPVNLKVGKQEVPFGQDKDIGISDPYVHGSTGDSFLNSIADIDADGNNDKIHHFGEVDNKFGVTLSTTPVGTTPTLELCVFQNDRGQDYSSDDNDDRPADDGLTQSYAARLTSNERVKGLTAEISYISMHREDNCTTEGMVNDSKAFSVGFVYKYEPVKVFGEVIMGSDLDYVMDADQDVYQFGVAVMPMPNVTVVAQYNSIIYKTEGSDSEPSLQKIALTPKYKLSNGVELALEYVRETLDLDNPAVSDDLTADAISARIKFKY